MVAALGAPVLSLVAIYLYTGPFGSRVRFDGVLRFRVPVELQVGSRIHQLLDRHCRRQVPLSVAELSNGETREHVYQVKFFRESDREALLEALRKDVDAHDARLMLHEASTEY